MFISYCHLVKKSKALKSWLLYFLISLTVSCQDSLFSVKGGEARSLECFVPWQSCVKARFPLVESQNHNVMESNVLLGKGGSSSSLHGPSGADTDRRSQSLSGNQPVKLFLFPNEAELHQVVFSKVHQQRTNSLPTFFVPQSVGRGLAWKKG